MCYIVAPIRCVRMCIWYLLCIYQYVYWVIVKRKGKMKDIDASNRFRFINGKVLLDGFLLFFSSWFVFAMFWHILLLNGVVAAGISLVSYDYFFSHSLNEWVFVPLQIALHMCIVFSFTFSFAFYILIYWSNVAKRIF